MTLLIVITSIIVYGCVGAVVCGAYDDFFNINHYVIFWPFIVITKTVKKLFGKEVSDDIIQTSEGSQTV